MDGMNLKCARLWAPELWSGPLFLIPFFSVTAEVGGGFRKVMIISLHSHKSLEGQCLQVRDVSRSGLCLVLYGARMAERGIEIPSLSSLQDPALSWLVFHRDTVSMGN